MCINVLFLGNLFPILLSVTKQHIFRSATPAIETDRFTRGKINFLTRPGTAPQKLWVEKISEIVSQNAISSLSSFWTLTISCRHLWRRGSTWLWTSTPAHTSTRLIGNVTSTEKWERWGFLIFFRKKKGLRKVVWTLCFLCVKIIRVSSEKLRSVFRISLQIPFSDLCSALFPISMGRMGQGQTSRASSPSTQHQILTQTLERSSKPLSPPKGPALLLPLSFAASDANKAFSPNCCPLLPIPIPIPPLPIPNLLLLIINPTDLLLTFLWHGSLFPGY